MRASLASPSACRFALVFALVATLSGCGGSSQRGNGVATKTPAQIVALAQAAVAGAATVHVAGSIVSDGKPISIDMELVAGKGGEGRIVLEGLSIDLVNADGALYIKGGSAFYSRFVGARAAGLLQGKWLKGSADGEAMAPLASLTDLLKLLDSTLADHGTLSRGPDATVDGQKAVGLTDPAQGGTLYVAATGVPYPLEIVKPGAAGGRVVFDRWNRPVTLTPPAGAINIKQLQSAR
jgi:hypothetical protein